MEYNKNRTSARKNIINEKYSVQQKTYSNVKIKLFTRVKNIRHVMYTYICIFSSVSVYKYIMRKSYIERRMWHLIFSSQVDAQEQSLPRSRSPPVVISTGSQPQCGEPNVVRERRTLNALLMLRLSTCK